MYGCMCNMDPCLICMQNVTACIDGKSDAEIIEMISNGVKQKKHSLGGNATSSAIAHHKNRPMILIGG